MEKQNTSVMQLFYSELEGEMWKHLSMRDDIHWNLDFIETNKDKLDWASLSENTSLPWSIELIGKYEDLWDWRKLSKKLSRADKFSIFMKVVDGWHDKVNWDDVSCSGYLTVEIAIKYSDRLNWPNISANKAYKWTIDFAQANIERIHWGILSQNLKLHSAHNLHESLSKSVIEGLSASTHQQPSIEFIACFVHKWDWDALSQNGRLVFNAELLNAFRDHWNWSFLINNPRVMWSTSMVEMFAAYIPTADIEFLKASHMWQMLLKEISKGLFTKCLANDIDIRLLIMRL